MSILLLHEDTYAEEFFKKLLELFNIRLNIEYRKLHGKCNTKVTRIINAARTYNIDKIIVVADAEGCNIHTIKNKIEQHIPNDLKSKTHYIIFRYSIEEWVCDGLGIEYKDNPSRTLDEYLRKNKNNRGYEKSMLPSLTRQIDIKRLRNNQEFTMFLS